MPPVITRELLEQEEEKNIKPLDDDDIALLKTYVRNIIYIP
jgi:hypothetical protein